MAKQLPAPGSVIHLVRCTSCNSKCKKGDVAAELLNCHVLICVIVQLKENVRIPAIFTQPKTHRKIVTVTISSIVKLRMILFISRNFVNIEMR